MKTIKHFAASLFAATATAALLFSATGANAQTPISSKVTEAVVFLQGAELTQTAQASLQKGANELAIEGLSPNIDRNSLKINIAGGVVVSAFEFSTDYLSSSKALPARLKSLKDSIDIYQAQLDRTNVDIRVNAEMQGYLEKGITKSVSGSETALGIDDLKKTMDYYKSKSEEILNGARELQKKHGKIEAALARVNSQYREEAGLTNKTTGVLRLNVSAPAAGNFPVTITYYTRTASWSPYYDINAAAIDRPVRFAAKSRVSQWTGLDWTNVRLTLSTSVPSGGRIAPLFSTWFLRERDPRLATRGAAAKQNSYSYEVEEEVMMMADYAVQAPAAEPAAASIYDYVTTDTNALNVTYNIDLPYSIPGNGKAQNIDLSVKEAAAEFKYYAVPKLDGATYLIAEIPKWEELGLLSAPANVTYAGTYIGETYIDAQVVQEKLTLTLGTDKRVAVTRELAKEFSATKSVGNTVERTFTYRLTVRNGQTKPVFVVLKDQYPVSVDKSIMVTLDVKTTTPPTVNKTDMGVVTWEETLAAGQSKEYTLSYTVRYPKDMHLDL